MLTVLDLFSGIGGFSLGLERTGGFKTVAFCEQAEYQRKVLAKHWPDVPIFKDIKGLNIDDIPIDVICGGFPCQDISVAGKGEGLNGERSGLWFEYLRLIGELGPRWVIVENVSALRSRGLVTILQNFSKIGYDAEWHCIPASYVGAPHQRDRIWIVAYPKSKRGNGNKTDRKDSITSSSKSGSGGGTGNVSNTTGTGLQGRTQSKTTRQPQSLFTSEYITKGGHTWLPEPDVGRVVDGVPSRVDRLKCLGNAVVPQIVTIIGNAILEKEKVNES